MKGLHLKTRRDCKHNSRVICTIKIQEESGCDLQGMDKPLDKLCGSPCLAVYKERQRG